MYLNVVVDFALLKDLELGVRVVPIAERETELTKATMYLWVGFVSSLAMFDWITDSDIAWIETCE
jgi:hypothetical protein